MAAWGMLISQRTRRIVWGLGFVAALGLLAWGGSVWAVYGRSAGRVFGPDEIGSVPVQRAAVVLGCVKTLPNGLDNLYYARRISAAAELYKAGKVRCLIVSGDNHAKGGRGSDPNGGVGVVE